MDNKSVQAGVFSDVPAPSYVQLTLVLATFSARTAGQDCYAHTCAPFWQFCCTCVQDQPSGRDSYAQERRHCHDQMRQSNKRAETVALAC